MTEKEAGPGQAEELRQRAEVALRESERFARAILDALSTHIAILDETGSIIAVNRAWRDFAQANHPSLSNVCEGANYLAVCDAVRGPDAEQAARFAAAVRAVMRGEQNEFSLEYPCHSPGEQRWFNVHVSRFPGEGAVCVVVAHENITERKRAEEALRESEARNRHLHESMVDAFASVSMDGRIRECNRAYRTMLGYSDEELKRLTYADLTPTRWHAFEARIIEEQVLPRGYSDVYEKEYRKKDGTVFPVELRTFLIRAVGQPMAMWAIVRDITKRKRAEEALRESEERFRAIANYTSDVEAWFGTDGRLLWINPSVERIMGYTPAECLGMPDFPLPLIHSEDTARVAGELGEAQQGSRSDDQEFRFVCKDGTVRWGSVSWQPIFDQNGQPLGHRTSVRDITRRKRAEEAVRASEEKYRQLIETTGTGYVILDDQGRVADANPEYVRLTGRQRLDEILGHSVLEWTVPHDLERNDSEVRKCLEQGFTHHLEIGYVTPAGQVIPVEINATVLRAPGTVQLLTLCRDITRRKRADEVLRESEERFRRLSEAAFEGILIHDGSVALSANDQFCEMLGYQPDELLGKEMIALVVAPESRDFVRQQIATGSLGPYEVVALKKDGTRCLMEIRAREMEHGEHRVRVAAVRDITERKRAEKRVQMFSQEIIAAREEERKQVSSVLHHDVGSLAVGISAHLDAIEEDVRSGKLGEALKWMKRTRKLFDEAVVRLKALAIQLRPPELDVLGLRAALRQYFAQVTERGGTRIHFRETLGRGRRRVSGDTATILFRVAQEALTNAITHGHAKRVDVGLRTSKEEVTLTVHDNGKGFGPSDQEARVTSQMGLRVMQEMAAAAGGAFTLDSTRGKGTTVRVSLPLKTAALGPGDVTVREETVARGKTSRSAGRGSRRHKGSRA